MRWHHVLRTKTLKKWIKKPNQHQIFPKVDEIANFG
jgi:hypothetical protein